MNCGPAHTASDVIEHPCRKKTDGSRYAETGTRSQRWATRQSRLPERYLIFKRKWGRNCIPASRSNVFGDARPVITLDNEGGGARGWEKESRWAATAGRLPCWWRGADHCNGAESRPLERKSVSIGRKIMSKNMTLGSSVQGFTIYTQKITWHVRWLNICKKYLQSIEGDT